MGQMLSTRPASRRALSDLIDLNLALKFDKKLGRQRETRQLKERCYTRRKLDGRAGGEKTRGHWELALIDF